MVEIESSTSLSGATKRLLYAAVVALDELLVTRDETIRQTKEAAKRVERINAIDKLVSTAMTFVMITGK